MPAGENPQAPGRHDIRIIEFKGLYGCTARRRRANDANPLFVPYEMLKPVLPARVEQGHGGFGHGILGLDLRALITVAPRTGKPEIVTFRGAAARLGKKVFEVHLRPADPLISQTVTTAMPGLVSNLRSQGLGNNLGHQLNSALLSSRFPLRMLSKATARALRRVNSP